MNRDDILKDKPDYEDYSENEAKLSIEEMRELGILRCGGCCSKKSNKNNKCSGCNKSKNAANQNDLLSNNRYEKGWKIDKILKENCKLKLCLKIIKLIEIFYKIY